LNCRKYADAKQKGAITGESVSVSFFMSALLIAIIVWTDHQNKVSAIQSGKAKWARQLKKLNEALDSKTTDALNASRYWTR